MTPYLANKEVRQQGGVLLQLSTALGRCLSDYYLGYLETYSGEEGGGGLYNMVLLSH